ncbi:hypothetical protein BH10ACT1_BH10ACT1_13430 [soil metagenome]
MIAESLVIVRLQEVAAATTAAARSLGGVGAPDRVVEVVAVAATELLTNALVHAGGPATLRVEVGDRSVRIGVVDADARPVEVGRLDPDRIGGNGLRIVEALADEWGTDLRPEGKEIWFRCHW